MPTLLVIDDEPNIRFTVAETLSSSDVEVATAGTGREGIEAVRAIAPDAVLLDVRLPDMSGFEAFLQIRGVDSRVPVIIMTAFTTTDTAIDAMSRGAFEYLVKPVDFNRLRDVLSRAFTVSRLSRVPALLPEDRVEAVDVDRIVGNSSVMQEVYKAIGRVTACDATVLIVGESGTGKELVARAIYQHSHRRDNPFLAINCAALPETLLESELFGHERGAFTGADQRRIGKFEQCNGGTMFLDEIGDMSLPTQAKALRLLQDQRFERIGGNATVSTDVRIIAATNRDLSRLIMEERFRGDLYYRLSGFTISLPPLRHRKDDIQLLIDAFLRRANHDLGRTIQSLTPEAVGLLHDYDWPGNIRELGSAIRYAALHAPGDVITADCLPESCAPGRRPSSSTGFDLAKVTRRGLADDHGDLYRRLSTATDRVILEEVMRYFNGNQAQAAERLGISRVTLRSKLRQLGMLDS